MFVEDQLLPLVQERGIIRIIDEYVDDYKLQRMMSELKDVLENRTYYSQLSHYRVPSTIVYHFVIIITDIVFAIILITLFSLIVGK